MKQVFSKFLSLILIALTIILSLSLCFYSIKHFPPSVMNYAIKLISLEKDSAALESTELYYQNLEDAILIAKNSSLKEKDNSDTYLELSKLCFDIFSMETKKKHQIFIQINPSSASEIYTDDLLFKEIYRFLYLSLQHSPSNFRPFLYLSTLANLKLNIGEGYITSESIQEAQELTKHYIETALKLNPSKSQVAYAAGKYFLQMGDVEKAAHHFLRAITVNKNLSNKLFHETLYEPDKDALLGIVLEKNPELQMLYGDFLARNGMLIEAERFYKSSLDLSIDKMEPYKKLCDLYFKAGKFEDVRLLSNKMLEKGYARNQSDLAGIFHNLALYFEKEGLVSDAIENAQKAIEKNKEQLESHYLISKLHLENEDYDKAISNLKFILSHFREERTRNLTRDIHILLGEAYEEKGDILKAYEEYNKALKLHPKNKEVQKRINFLKRGLR